MWEVLTCGRVPYAGIHAMGLLSVLKRGERLEKPDNKACHDDMLVLNVAQGQCGCISICLSLHVFLTLSYVRVVVYYSHVYTLLAINISLMMIIRASVDALCRDGTSEISRDPRTKRLQTRRESLAMPSKHTNNNF